MPARTNAIAELTRFWLQARHGCLVDEAVPVPVPYALSDIDLIAITPDLRPIHLPDGSPLGPRMIVETKDEHDWEPRGVEFSALFAADVEKMGCGAHIPKGTRGVKFTMLRQEHYEKAAALFGCDDFDRLFVVHAIDSAAIRQSSELLRTRRITILSIRDVVADIDRWYRAHPRKAGLRYTLVGDLWHLLVGFCGYGPTSVRTEPTTRGAA